MRFGGGQHFLAVWRAGFCRYMEAEALQPPHAFTQHRHIAILRHGDMHRAGIVTQSAHQLCRAPIHEAFGQLGVERV